MIESISLNHFKSFIEMKDLRIAPITILTGLNSSGKSSILHSLLLLKQSLMQSNVITGEALLLDGSFLQYSKLREMTYNLPLEQSAMIEYSFSLSTSTVKGLLSFQIRHKELPNYKNHYGPVVTKFTWQSNFKSKSISLRDGKYICPRIIREKLPEIPKNYKKIGNPYVLFERFLPKYIIQETEYKSNKHKLSSPLELIGFRANKTSMLYHLFKLINDFEDELLNLEYLGPSRAVPRRAYLHYSGRNDDLDNEGNNVAQIYWLKKDDKVHWNNKMVNLVEAVNDCLSKVGLEQKILPRCSKNIVYQLLVETNDPYKKVTIADVGFGYSQLLPIILRGLLSEKNALLLFEQPEIHLHPSAKAKLADLFIAFMKSGRRVMVETHSTELINRLQLKVIENPELKNELNVVFVNPPKNNQSGSTIRQLSLDNDGTFDQWPEGFCDESEKLARQMIEANVNRIKKNNG